VNTQTAATANRAAIEQRYRDFYGTLDTGSEKIMITAISVLNQNGGGATFQKITDEVVALRTVNRDLVRAMRRHCSREGVTPPSLTDAVVKDIISAEVRRHCLTFAYADEAAEEIKKEPRCS